MPTSGSDESDAEPRSRISRRMDTRVRAAAETTLQSFYLVWLAGCFVSLLVIANVVCLVTTTRKVDEMYTVLRQLMEFYDDV